MPLTTSSAAFLVATCAYLGIRSYFKRRFAGTTGAGTKRDKADVTLGGLVVVGQIVLPLLAIFSPWLDSTQYQTPLPAFAWGGTLLMASGIWLFWRSHADLGENWSVTLEVQQHHKLVSSGVYQKIRHPMYASFFVMAIGQLALLPNWVAGPSALLAGAMLYSIRKPREEAMLLDPFGDDYRIYMSTTGGVFPRFGAADAQPRSQPEHWRTAAWGTWQTPNPTRLNTPDLQPPGVQASIIHPTKHARPTCRRQRR